MPQPHWSSCPGVLQAAACNPRGKESLHVNTTIPSPVGEHYPCHSQGGQLDEL